MRLTGRDIVLASALLSLFALGCGSTDSPTPDELEGVSQEEVPELATSEAALSCTSTSSVVPVMTSATAPSGSVTRSGAYGSAYEAWQAFDSSNTSMWISAVYQTPAWIQYDWPDAPRLVTSYAITFVNGTLTSRAPRAWTLQGWTGSSWAVVDTRTNETGWAGVQTRTYTVASPNSYMKYRLNITDDNDPASGIVVVSMGRLELFGCAQAHCGFNGEACCPGSVCSGSLTCVSGTCRLLCGSIGQRCCDGLYCVQGGCGQSGFCQSCGYRNGPCCGNSCDFLLSCNLGWCR